MHMRGEDGVPVRPLLPPAALAAAAMVGSCAYVIDGGWVAYLEGTASLVDVRRLACVAVLSCLFAAAAWRLSSTGPADSFAASASILRFMAAGCALAALASTGWLVRMDASRSARAHLSMPLSIAVSGDAAKSATGWSASGVVNDAPEGAVRLRISSSDELSRGSVVRLYGSLEELPDSAWGRSRFVRGEVGVVSVRRFTVERMDASLLDSLRSTVLAVIEPQRDDARALCAGIVWEHDVPVGQRGIRGVFRMRAESSRRGLRWPSGPYLILSSTHAHRDAPSSSASASPFSPSSAVRTPRLPAARPLRSARRRWCWRHPLLPLAAAARMAFPDYRSRLFAWPLRTRPACSIWGFSSAP